MLCYAGDVIIRSSLTGRMIVIAVELGLRSDRRVSGVKGRRQKRV